MARTRETDETCSVCRSEFLFSITVHSDVTVGDVEFRLCWRCDRPEHRLPMAAVTEADGRDSEAAA